MSEAVQDDALEDRPDEASTTEVNDLKVEQGSRFRGNRSLDAKTRRALRRRLLRSANLKTLWGTVDVDTRLIIETLSGEIHPRNGDVISRMLERHSHMLERARQDEQRQQLVEQLSRLGALPGSLPGPEVAGALSELGMLPDASKRAGESQP